MRYAIIKICIDENGHYSVDAPTLDQGGTIGFGTEHSGLTKNFDETGELVKAKLEFFYDYFMDLVAKHEKNKKKN